MQWISRGKRAAMASAILALAACGGGDSGGDSGGGLAGGGEEVAPGVCSVQAEKTWARAHLDDVYLWYREILDVPPAGYDRVESYFAALLVKPRDRFSFVTGREDMASFQQYGLQAGYGANWDYEGRYLRATFVEPASPAAAQGVLRGDFLWALNDQPVETLSFAEVVRLLNPAAGEHVQLSLSHNQAGFRTLTLTAADFARQPVADTVLTLPEGDRVGYLLFNDHILPATDALTAAVRRFQTAGISDLVLDLRYNGGGFLSVASRLAYMLSGPATDNQTFFRLAFNDKHRDDDYNFGFMNLDNQDRALPRLNLKRVYVIIDSRTCSASEAVINGLRPFLPVYTIGSATCGKPYGFIQTDYCDKTYFAVRFQGANRDGASVPETGFSADCPARDDPDYALGEPGEAMLASALTLRRTGACPGAEAFQRRDKALPPPLRPLPREPWRDNLIAP